MTVKKYYIGGMGPYLYDDTDLIDDVDGDFAGKTQHGLITDGPIASTHIATKDDELVRKADIESDITSYLVNTVSDLKSRSFPSHIIQLYLEGYNSRQDGGEGWFYIDRSDSSTPEDDGIVFVNDDGLRIKRYYDGSVNTDWFDPNTEFGQRVNDIIGAGYNNHIIVPYKSAGISYSTTIDLSLKNTILEILGNTELTFTGSGAAIKISRMYCRLLGGKWFYKGTSADNSNWGDSVSGIFLEGANTCKVDVITVWNFEKGIHVKGGSTFGSAYNQINFHMLWTNQYNIYIEEGASHANENMWYGKRLGCASSEQIASQYDIYIATATTHIVNNNSFFGISCEGYNGIYCDGYYNAFFSLRFETNESGNKIEFGSNSLYNFVFGGYGIISPVDNGEYNCVFARGASINLPSHELRFRGGTGYYASIYSSAWNSLDFYVSESKVAELDNSGNLNIAGTLTGGVGANILSLTGLSSDPDNPSTGNAVMWISDGTGSGNAGDLIIKTNVSGVIYTDKLNTPTGDSWAND